MSCSRFLLISAAVIGGTFSPIGAQVTTGPISTTRDYVFPPVGLGASETASITVVNTAAPASPGGDSTAQAPSCSGTISFFNANGAIGAPTPFAVGSEQFMTVVLPFAKAGLPGNRGEIHAKVSLICSLATPTPCSLVTTLETYDSAMGVTHTVLTPAKVRRGAVLPIVVLDPR